MARKSEHIASLLDAGVDVIDDQPEIQVVSETDLGKLAADESFMNEIVTIVVHPTTDPNAAPYCVLNVNGERAVVFRNAPVKLKRKFVEVLSRMKETRWLQSVPEGYVGQVDMGSLRGHTGLVYPFSVTEDKNPKGSTWLANILAEPA